MKRFVDCWKNNGPAGSGLGPPAEQLPTGRRLYREAVGQHSRGSRTRAPPEQCPPPTSYTAKRLYKGCESPLCNRFAVGGWGV
jgi:hypothetical protein